MTSSDLSNKQGQGWAITLFTIGVFMAGLDNGIISTALTTIGNHFEVSPSWATWSVTLYTLGTAISVPIVGKLSDRYGRKLLFLIGISIFGIGSLLVSMSPNFIFLIISRFIQSLGGGGIFIIGTSHILATIPRENQGKALGLLGGMHGLSAIIGPNMGALIYNLTGGWKWMFLINIPIAIALVLIGFFKIEESVAPSEGKIDVIGSFLLGTGILALMFGITSLEGTYISFEVALIGILLGVSLFILFILHERRVELIGHDPILSYQLLRKPNFQWTLLLGLLSGGFLAGIIFVPAFVENVLHIRVQDAGFWLTPMALASGIGAGGGGFLTDRIGATRTIVVAGVLGIVGFGLFPFTEGAMLFIVASTFSGIGLGMLLGAPLNVLVGASATKNEEGSAVGALSLVRQIGLTIFPMVYALLITEVNQVAGFKNLYIVATALAIIVTICGLYLGKKMRENERI